MKMYQEVWPVDDERGCIVVVHGAGEYFVRYHWLAEKLNTAGYSVIGGDLPGLGRSEGKRGHIGRFEEYYDAVDQWMQEARKRTSPLFLLGHSLGGLIVTRYMETARPDVAGLILSSPCLGISRRISPALAGIASILNKVAPSLRLSAGIKAEELSRDRYTTAKYTEDPYIMTKVSVRWYKEVEKAISLAHASTAMFPDIPTLVMQAGEDRIVTPAATRAWMEALSVSRKQYIEWPACYHEIFNEPEKEDVVQTMLEWMNDVCPNS